MSQLQTPLIGVDGDLNISRLNITHSDIVAINHIMAKRKILRDHNWPSADYDTEKCVAALLAFEKQARELSSAMEDAAPYEVRSSWMAHPAYIEPERAYDKFLTDAAGDLAF